MKFGSVCSGIEAASVAWEPLDWEAAWFSEIEPFPSAVLAHHYPQVPNLGDMTALPERIRSGEVEAPDILCGGTPCQAFSFAGKRQSLDDARGNLSLTFCEIANAIDDVRTAAGKPEAIVFWENVRGVLSTKDNAFGCFLGELAGESCQLEPPGGRWANAGVVHGPARTIAWRTLDAQYFGVAQRRVRVFVVASARKDIDPAAILFEFDRLRRDSAPRREAGQEIAGTLASRTEGGGFPGTDEACSGYLQPVAFSIQAGALRENPNSGPDGMGVQTDHAYTLAARAEVQAVCHPVICMAHGQASAEIGMDFCPTLTCNHEAPIAMHAMPYQDVTGALCAADGKGANGQHEADHKLVPVWRGWRWAVRRIMPVECERLQGFPDNYTRVPYRKKPADKCPDGPRYKALGNSWAVPNVRWIGARIALAVAIAAAGNDNRRAAGRGVA